MTLDLNHFKGKLDKEKAKLENDLSQVARKNPDNPMDWEPVPAERDTSQADDNIVADGVEDFEENTAITNTLEPRYKDVLSALERIRTNQYGLCEVCGGKIEPDRLEANPAARTCKTHLDERL